MAGWMGKILRVNLDDNSIAKEDLNYSLAKEYIGGRGYASRLLYDEIDPSVDPFSPGNKIIFATGPLTGTIASASSRYMVVTKGALTGAIASSNSGGYFPAEIKYAGYDMIIVEGKAKKPVYILIENEKVEIKDSAHLWGKDTWETEDNIRSENNNEEIKVCCIGQAGEKLVRMACIVNDKHRGAGRSGVGAVMGSKLLKAIAVRGTGSIKVAKQNEFREAALKALAKIKESPVTSQGLPTYGTDLVMNVVNEQGFLPTRNFREGVFEGAYKVGGENLAATYLVRKKGCLACPIACGRVTRIPDPDFPHTYEGPEYESAWALGTDCGVDDLKAVTKANFYCNKYGMDPISVGSTIACAMELFEIGVLSEKDVGMLLNFGNAEAMVEMVKKIGERSGIGNDLAEGSMRFSKKYGHPELFMGVKGQEFPAYDGRGAQGMGLNYATSNRGACHVRGYTISTEVFGIPEKVDPFVTTNKAAINKGFQDMTAVVDSSGLCLFNTFAFGTDEILSLMQSATGTNYTKEELLLAGERIWNLERLFNLKAGITAADDTLPERILKEPIPAGPAKGKINLLHEMLPEYYRLRGWDASGIPTAEKLTQLRLMS